MIGSVWKIFELKGQLMNQLMNHGGDCRTAPATTGPLNIYILVSKAWMHIVPLTGHNFFLLLSNFVIFFPKFSHKKRPVIISATLRPE